MTALSTMAVLADAFKRVTVAPVFEDLRGGRLDQTTKHNGRTLARSRLNTNRALPSTTSTSIGRFPGLEAP